MHSTQGQSLAHIMCFGWFVSVMSGSEEMSEESLKFHDINSYAQDMLKEVQHQDRFPRYQPFDKPLYLISRMKKLHNKIEDETWSRQDIVKQQQILTKRKKRTRKKEEILQKKEDLLFTGINLILQALHRMAKRGESVTSGFQPEWSILWGYDCFPFYKAGYIQRTVVHSLWTRFNHYKTRDVTLSVHLTLDRYDVFDLMLSYWHGPVSAAIYVGPEHIQNTTNFLDKARKWLTRDNIDLHFVPKQEVSMTSSFLD